MRIDQEEEVVQAAYGALERSVNIVRGMLPEGWQAAYESPPGFVWVRVGPRFSLSFGLENETFGWNVNILDEDGDDTGLLDESFTLTSNLSSDNAEPVFYALEIMRACEAFVSQTR